MKRKKSIISAIRAAAGWCESVADRACSDSAIPAS
jgi:hypothetical protein